ncbi:glycoside hydrolase family 43 protein [Sphingomonas psychrotolerans]|uniref:Alpha-N-arabinofuranosidase n=1 Tax=Sphingomonas psychrotolerans TaxID=1327635 RepID=A0A2K8MFV0_9SPHN|nr:glycoside hydrolase family 43 protein [Sphingomonas psychrotolerans]ATY30619.1 alpha-N-arabinofuranosidase [Sphingomonas psychrotolerans]
MTQAGNLLRYGFALASCALLPGGAAGGPQRFTNPLLPSGPDPWIVRDGRDYYYLNTLGDRIAIRKTRDLGKLAEAEEKTVWRAPADGLNAQSIWAPELHRIRGKWYIYYTAAAAGHDDDAHRSIFVLENAARDPQTGSWTDRGRLATRNTGIDGTTFTHAGKRYFVYSPYIGADSNLAIVEMANPWTLKGPESIIAQPDQPWERQGGRQILEGPEFLRGPKGQLYISYSGSACWSDDYAIGLLRAPAGANPLDPAAWTKAPHPVITKSPTHGVYAPGHNGFFTTPGGEIWIIYHANSGPDMKCTSKRAPRIRRVTFGREGRPAFGETVGAGTLR